MSLFEPYLLWIKIGFVALLVAALFSAGLWVSSVISERDSYRVSDALKTKQVEMYAKAYEDNRKLQKEMADAIKGIRIQSRNVINNIESEAEPIPDASGFVVLIDSGWLSETVSGMPSTFTNNSSSGVSSSLTTR